MRVWVVEFLDMYQWLRVQQQLLLIERSTDVFVFLSGSSNYRMSFFSFHRINAREQNIHFFSPFQRKSAMWVCYRKMSCWEKKSDTALGYINKALNEGGVCWDACIPSWMLSRLCYLVLLKDPQKANHWVRIYSQMGFGMENPHLY